MYHHDMQEWLDWDVDVVRLDGDGGGNIPSAAATKMFIRRVQAMTQEEPHA